MNSTTQDEPKPLNYYHLSHCSSYEILRGIYPNDRRETGKPCSCGFDTALQLAVVSAKLEENQTTSNKMVENGVPALDYNSPDIYTVTGKYFKARHNELTKQKAELQGGDNVETTTQ